MYLLDTMIVSESGKRTPHPGVTAWVAAQPQETCFLSVVSLIEIERGITLVERRDGRFASRVRSWLDETIASFAGRILPVTIPVARHAGRLQARIGHKANDVVIAATADVHALTVVTRNVRDFAPLGARTFDPYTDV